MLGLSFWWLEGEEKKFCSYTKIVQEVAGWLAVPAAGALYLPIFFSR